MVNALRDDIGGGLSLSLALARHPQVFSASYVSLVGAGEEGGFLASVLEQIMALEKNQAEMRGRLVSALSYPVFLIVFSIGVVLFVLIAVFPKFGDMFSSIADQLPVVTLFLMGVSELLRQYWLPLLVMLVVGGALLVRWARSPGGRLQVDRWKLGLPVIRDVYARLYLAESLRVIGLSLENGVSSLDALRACHAVVDNRVFQDLLAEAERHINEGRGLAEGFSRSPIVPDLAKQMIKTGEDSGRLPLVMARVADFYQQELAQRLELFSKLVEPVMLLVMGAVVGLIVSSLILPIFKLAHTVQ